MTFDQLSYFVAVAEKLNFTKAAALLHISQTAVTQQIKSLEKDLGVRLFNRTNRHVELTPAGNIALNEAKVLLNRSQEAKTRILLASKGFAGFLNIGFLPNLPRCKEIGLADRIAKFKSFYPDISLRFESNNCLNLLKSLTDFSNDLIFTFKPSGVLDADLIVKNLSRIPLYVLLHLYHPLAHKREINHRELQNETFIIIQAAEADMLNDFSGGGFTPKNILRASDIESLCLMVSANMGIAILPEYNISSFNESYSLRAIPLVNTSADFEIIMAYHSQNQNPALEHFVAKQSCGHLRNS